MGIGPIVNLASSYIQSLFTQNSSPTQTTSATTTPASVPQDQNQLSPFASILSTLQQLQQSNPAQYQQVTQTISSNLQSAANSATGSGHTALATELTQLSTDFKNASSSGQLPNVQDLAQAVGGSGHHHHHHHHGGGASEASSTTPSSTSTSTDLSQYFQSLAGSQTGSSSAALNPLSIISSTLSSAGIQIG
jgi:hypothetical protein